MKGGMVVDEEESKGALLVASGPAVNTENRSTMTMGVEHFGQRKQVGWVGEEVMAAGGAAWDGRRAGADREVRE